MKKGELDTYIDRFIKTAVRDDARVLVFACKKDSMTVRETVGGAVLEMPPPPDNLSGSVMGRLRVRAGLDLGSHTPIQQGRIGFPYGFGAVKSTLEFNATYRIFKSGTRLTLRRLYYGS